MERSPKMAERDRSAGAVDKANSPDSWVVLDWTAGICRQADGSTLRSPDTNPKGPPSYSAKP
ncbi:hypothetical protein GCM10028864_08850 [Microlunatus parietis]